MIFHAHPKINDWHFRSEQFMKVILIQNRLLLDIFDNFLQLMLFSSFNLFNLSFFFQINTIAKINEIVVIKPSGRCKTGQFCLPYFKHPLDANLFNVSIHYDVLTRFDSYVVELRQKIPRVLIMNWNHVKCFYYFKNVNHIIQKNLLKGHLNFQQVFQILQILELLYQNRQVLCKHQHVSDLVP